MKKILGIVAALPLLAWPVLGNASDGVRGGVTAFIGLWEGVDPDDGSLTQRAVTCDRGGSCEVLGSDQFFSFCAGSDGRGLLAGTGTIEGGVLLVPDFMLSCADGSATPAFVTRFSLDRSNGTLTEDTEGPPPAIVFHRLSDAVRGRR